jgi:acyl-CoA synthetase (AMP-forming)/AMP-acid ligase II
MKNFFTGEEMKNCQSLTEALQVSLANRQRIFHIQSDSEAVTVTCRQLYQNACDILAYLQSRGLKPGDKLIIAVEDNEFFLNLFWACLLGKIIPAPVAVANNDEHRLKIVKIWMKLSQPYLMTSQKLFAELGGMIRAQQLSGVAGSFESRVLLVHQIDKTAPPCTLYHASGADIAFIQFSSGSTGDPKGVVLTHQNLMTNIRAIIDSARLASDDVMLSWMPLTHDLGLIGFHLTPMICGANQYHMPTSLFIRRPILWLDQASQIRATILASPNFGYQYFLTCFNPKKAKDWDLSRVRLIFNGAEPISARLCNDFLDEMSQYGLKRTAMFPVYGMAEASLAVTFPPLDEEPRTVILDRKSLNIGNRVKEAGRGDLDSIALIDVGYPIKDCWVRICSPEGKVLNTGKVGLVEIKGENVTRGYYGNLPANAAVISCDGWFNTGDLGFLRNDGRLVITGRLKEVIFINGLTYYAPDIESVVREVAGTKGGEIAACGIFNAGEQREEIILFVRFKKELSDFEPLAAELSKHIRFKMGLEVKAIIPVPKMPKTTSGKVKRFKLKEMYENGIYKPVSAEAQELPACRKAAVREVQNSNVIETQLLQVWADLFENGLPGVDDNLWELVGDSLLIAKFGVYIEARNIAKLSIADLFAYPTIRKLAWFIIEGNKEKNRAIGRY